jgi:Mrp family chromosome partitioning ATPase
MAAPLQPQARGEIITFYSYKGGTGRTMALANVACVLVEQLRDGEQVLVVDWDLEAPGLHRFFPGRLGPQSVTSDGELDSLPGLMDALTKLRDRLPPERAISPEASASVVADVFSGLDVNAFVSDSGIANVRIMRAGSNDHGQYAREVNTFDWEGLFSRAPTVYRELAEWLAKTFRYVLIDSRTGVTDISGICTSLLPEKLVVVFTPNRQSLTGVRELVERATSYRRESDDLRPLLVFPLPSRIEASLQDLRARWRFGDRDHGIVGYQPMFEELFRRVYAVPDCDLSRYFDEVQIQQTPDYAYGEEIAVRRSSDRFSLEKSYRVFADRLVSGAPAWVYETAPVEARPVASAPPTKQEAAVGAPGRDSPFAPSPDTGAFPAIAGPAAPSRKAFLSHSTQDHERIREIRAALEASGLEVWSPEQIQIGKTLRNEVAQALDESDVVVVCWSKSSISSDWVLAEAGEGLRRGILAPALLDDVAPPVGFRTIQSADLSRGFERGIARLVETANRIAQGRPAATEGGQSLAPAVAKSALPFRGWRLAAATMAVLVLVATTAAILLFLRSSLDVTNSASTLPPKSFRVPNFVGSQSVDALNTAKVLGLQLIMTDEQGKVFPSLEGVVTGQTPAADQEVAEGTPVRVAISTSAVTTPTLVGMNLTQALAVLLRAKLQLGTTQSKVVRDAREGTILEQSPAPGMRVPSGSRVDVTVATQGPIQAPSTRGPSS